jgi:hypothetical protein
LRESRKRLVSLSLAGLAILLGVAVVSYYRMPAGREPVTDLEKQSIEVLKARFNRAADEFRVILLLSPT